MKKYILLTFFFVFFSMISCSEKTDLNRPNVDFNSLEKDFMKWWTYHNDNIVLSSDFIAVDNSTKIINKGEFLSKLTSGEFIPLKLITADHKNYYKLFKLDKTSDKDIRSTIKITSAFAYDNFKLEGKDLPIFDFKDLNGVEYTNENTKGKIVIIKCWFIACRSCVAEFPELNKLVEKYKDRNDIVFISLAYDPEKELNQFLSKKPFSYAVIGNQEQFLRKELGINMFPTHLIIDGNGVIRKVVNKASELIIALASNESLTSAKTNGQLPPAPPPTIE